MLFFGRGGQQKKYNQAHLIEPTIDSHVQHSINCEGIMENQHGICALCNQPLTDYQVLFERRIERMEYLPMGPSEFQAMVTVLDCEDIACYCSTDCANIDVQKGLQDRGIKNTGGSYDPVTSCAKCGSIVDLTQPHAHYVKMEVTVNKTLSQNSLTVLDDEGLADVCINCAPDGALFVATEQSEPSAHTVMPPVRV
jgi:hypothetical protein